MVSFCNVFDQGCRSLFLIDGWVKIFFDLLMVGSAKYLPRKTFLFGTTPHHK
jgi:hypothetical protein